MKRFKNWLMECAAFWLHLFLFILAWALFLPLCIINYKVVLFKAKDHAKGYFRSSALNLDRYANREFRTLWNTTLRKLNGEEFGNIEESISGILGKNQRDGTLTTTGRVLALILDTIEKDHCKNSIGY